MNDWMMLAIGSALRSSVVIALAWLLTLMLRRAAASTRHLVWTSALFVVLATPVLMLALPQLRVALPRAVAVTVDRVPAAIPVVHKPAPAGARRADGVVPASGRRQPADIGTVAMTLWALGAGAFLVYTLAGVLITHRLRRRAVLVPAPLPSVAGCIAVAHSPDVTTPFVSGVFRPLILVPAGAANWSPERLRVVLLHELAHVRRRDCLTQLVVRIACAIHWFNPLVWIAARRLRIERERACDDAVLASGVRGSDYAHHLIDIAKTAPPPRLVHAAGVAMAHRSQLEGRLMSILNPRPRITSASVMWFIVAAFVLVAGLAASVRIQAQAQARTDGGVASEGRIFAKEAKVRVNGQTFFLTGAEIAVAGDQTTVFSGAISTRRAPREGRAVDRALLEAAQDGDLEGIQQLFVAGAKINTPIHGDGTALIAAAREGQLEAVRLLLERGADPHLAVEGEGSALIAAAREGQLEVVRLLLDRGADPHLAVEGDGSALIAAAQGGYLPIAQLLVQRGANVNQAVEGDETPLINAAAAGQLEMVKFLAGRGADVNAHIRVERVGFDGQPAGDEWRSPLSMARKGRHTAVVQYLQSLGAVD
jgi:beta-lactamase regulating signal transducer with metallopeptidase domain/ankyrin repeat protein